MSDIFISSQDPASGNKEVIIEIDPIGSGGSAGNTYSVTGKMVNESNVGQPNITVKAYHKAVIPINDIDLGETETNAEGNYLIYYNTNQLLGKTFANLKVVAFDGENELVQSDTYINAPATQVINLTDPTLPSVEPIEYDNIKSLIDTELNNSNPALVEVEGLNILAQSIGETIEVTSNYIQSAIFSDEYPTISGEVFYGLFRYGLSTTATELLETKPAQIREAITATAQSNIIDPDILDDIEAILTEFAALAPESWLVDPVAIDGETYLAKILSIAGISDTAERANFVGSYLEYGSLDTFWTDLPSQDVFTTDVEIKISDIKKALQIGVISQEHAPMVLAVFPNITNIAEIGAITRAQWLSYMNATNEGSTTIVGFPNIEATEASLVESNKESYADALMDASEKAFPTEMLIQFMSADSAFNTSSVYNFLVANPDYDISRSSDIDGQTKETSPKDYFSNNNIDDEDLLKKLYKLRRLWHLASGYNKLDQIKILAAKGFGSASQIANIGERSFISNNSGDLGVEGANKIYKRAVKRTAAAIKLHTNYSPTINNISTAVYTDASLSEAETNSKPNLDTLFGSMDYCECDHCKSSFGPAAYFIDLLTFLKQSEVYDDSNTVTGQNGWDIFQSKRPELLKIELNCENTLTPLPYIDIVNEILEYEIAERDEIVEGEEIVEDEDLDRQSTRSAQSLRIQPEHLNASAYNKLFDGSNESVNAWSLPFHLWNEEAKAYLQLLKIDRYSLTNALEGNGNKFSTTSAKVYLNISTALNDVLIESSDFIKFYNGAISTTLNDVENLLDKSGLGYDELILLVEANYINPTNAQIVFEPASSCKLKDATLGFTAIEYRNLHRFSRLQKLLKWDINTLDTAFTLFHQSNIDDDFITKLAGTHLLSEKFGITAIEALSWFGALSETSYNDQPSTYDQVFLDPIYNTNDTTQINYTAADLSLFEVDSINLDSLNSAVLLGVTRLSAQELLSLLKEQGEIVDGLTTAKVMSKEELTHIYRVSSFVKALGISVEDYLTLKKITNTIPISSPNPNHTATPNDTLEFIDTLERIRRSSFSIQQLQFLFLHENLASFKVDETSLLETVEAIRIKLQEKIQEKGISPQKTREDLLNMFLLFMGEADANISIEIVDEVITQSIPASMPEATPAEITEAIAEATVKATANIEKLWDENIGSTSGIINLIVIGTETEDALTDPQERINVVFDHFNTALTNVLALEDEIHLAIADNYGFSQSAVAHVLKEELAGTDYFSNSSFLLSEGEVSEQSDFVKRKNLLISVVKIVSCLEALNVEPKHFTLVCEITSNTSWYDQTTLPITTTSIQITGFDSFIDLINSYELEQIYYQKDVFSIIDYIESDSPNVEKLHAGTGWDLSTITYLINAFTHDTSGKWLTKAQAFMTSLNKLGISHIQFQKFAAQDLDSDTAQSLQATVKSNFSSSAWEKVAIETRDQLRAAQRDAMVAYLIANRTEFEDTTALYEHFLLDVEMAPCMLSSRIKMAISSVQLWIQRIRINLETDINFLQEQMDEWEWRKNYRVWEAARKVFTYPENWLEPELRDDKSPFFKELEDQLLESEVTLESTEKIYLNYLNNLDEVSTLDIGGIFEEEDRDILHVYARTKSLPHIYYYRRQEDGFQWTAWEKLDIDIAGDHLIPVVFNRRPMLFWPIFVEKPIPLSNDDLNSESDSKLPQTFVEITLGYSEWKNGKWQAKRISTSKIASGTTFEPSNYFFKIDVSEENGLRIDGYFHETPASANAHIGSFTLQSISSNIQVDVVQKTTSPSLLSVENAYHKYMKLLEENGNDQFSIMEKYNFVSASDSETIPVSFNNQTILNATPGRFKITSPISGVDLLAEKPFFFEDDNRVFFVKPSEERFERTQLIQLPMSLLRIKRSKIQTLNSKEETVIDTRLIT